MAFHGTILDREFLRQALGEKRLTREHLAEIAGAQAGLYDRELHRAIPVVAHELGLLDRPLVEQLIRHVLRRLKGAQIGGYRIKRQVGRGGMGVVYESTQIRMKRTVALKLLIRRDMSEKFVERFKREGYASASLRHENLVAAFDVGTADGWHYFAMEYVDGPTIARILKESGAFSELEAIRLTRQVAEALDCAHTNGIIHRDIKPGNIMVASSGKAKLCDLGLARIRNIDESELYEPGTTLGSRRYMSPEQARGLGNIDERTDIYSLGLTLFYMITGVPPFSDIARDDVMAEHIRGVLEWPADINPAVSEKACEMVWRMSAKDPDRRPASARQLVIELKALESELIKTAEIAPDAFDDLTFEPPPNVQHPPAPDDDESGSSHDTVALSE
jgi:eukaryotic-like serine/threonine-protein kinase